MGYIFQAGYSSLREQTENCDVSSSLGMSDVLYYNIIYFIIIWKSICMLRAGRILEPRTLREAHIGLSVHPSIAFM